MDTIIKVIGYEEARTNFLKSEMEKAQHRIKFWQTKIKKAKNAIAEMEARDNASNAGWEYNFYKDALEALEAGEDINVLTAQPKWISVEERLPEKHGQICVGLYNQHGADKPILFPHVFKWYAYGNNGYINGPHFSDEGLDGLKVYYWMPLPEPPKGV